MTAILNEGLDAADTELKGWKPLPKIVIPKERRCTVPGCEQEKIAKGYLRHALPGAATSAGIGRGDEAERQR